MQKNTLSLECFSYQKRTNVLNNLATREGKIKVIIYLTIQILIDNE